MHVKYSMTFITQQQNVYNERTGNKAFYNAFTKKIIRAVK